jgi:acyl-CoA hydrolase/GNAT superfamily N-acetyltransferase
MPKSWEGKITSPDAVLQKIEPGMSIFIGTGVAEPRTLVKALMHRNFGNLYDLEIIQLISLGDAICLRDLGVQKYRLKTFFSGWAADEAIKAGRVDLVPSRFARIPALIASGLVPVNAAFIQITPPDETGNCSLGVAVDAAREAMDKASLVVGEICSQIPRTYGDTFVDVSEFDYLVQSVDPPIYFDRWPADAVYDRIAANVSVLVEDRCCIAFSIGPLYEALSRHLCSKKHLGVHSPFFTDALMALVESGAVSNRYKELFTGKSLVSYAIGTPALMAWLDRNPRIEFQGVDKVFDPRLIGRNKRFIAILAARKADLSGLISLNVGKGNVATGPAEMIDFFHGAEISEGGRIIFALPSRNRSGEPNIMISVADLPNLFAARESVDMIVTEYGVARLRGYSMRERAQAMIDIAHPDDRSLLVSQAKLCKIIYPDQIFIPEGPFLYPEDIRDTHTFKGGQEVHFRPIKPSDEEEMRRLFYRFSDDAVYYRYFGHMTSMPHAKMQAYVNVDWSRTMSIVGLVEAGGRYRIVAEARYIREDVRPLGEIVFVVDEEYQGLGIATYLYQMLILLAKQRGLHGFTADVLFSNQAMMKVFRKGGLPLKATLDAGIYQLTILFDQH